MTSTSKFSCCSVHLGALHVWETVGREEVGVVSPSFDHLKARCYVLAARLLRPPHEPGALPWQMVCLICLTHCGWTEASPLFGQALPGKGEQNCGAVPASVGLQTWETELALCWRADKIRSVVHCEGSHGLRSAGLHGADARPPFSAHLTGGLKINICSLPG